MRTSSILLRIVASVVAIAVATTALAAPPAKPKAGREAARPLALEGVALYESGRYEDAIDRFERAEALFHAPQNLVYIARAQDKLGRLLAARRTYEGIIADGLPRKAAFAAREAYKTARAELAALEERIPALSIAVTGPLAAGARVTLDGRDVPESARSSAQVDPGEHRVEATAHGAAPASRAVTVAEGAKVQVELSLSPPPPPPEPPRSPGPPRALTFAAFGAGAVGLGVGSIFGALSIAKVSDIAARCAGVHCPRSAASDAEDADTLANVSNVGFIVGAAGVAAGGALLFLSVSAGPAREGSAAVRARVSANGVRIEGVF